MKGVDLKRRREALGLSQDDIADILVDAGALKADLRYRRQTVYRWEKGIHQVPALTAALLDARLSELERKSADAPKQPVV